MKANRLHEVPLSDQAVAILERVRALGRSDPLIFVFPGSRGRLRPVNGTDLARLLRPLELVDAQHRPVTVHGFRATFRAWALQVARAPFEMAEAALAHRLDETQEAYLRPNDTYVPRPELMQLWADYVCG